MDCNFRILIGIVFSLFASIVFAQEPELVLDKKGDFKIVEWGVYTNCMDCGITKSESSENYSKLTALANSFRVNPVLKDIKGFDCQVVLYSENMWDTQFRYGIPSKMSIQFCYFFMNKDGKVGTATIEPPDFDVQINQLKSTMCGGFGFKVKDNVKDADNPNFNQKKWEKAAEKTREIFFTPGKKENLMPGIDRYASETVIIYHPDRPDYWVPVTIREVFEALIEFYAYDPDNYTSEMTLKILKEEYALYSEDERNKYAYLGGRGSVPLSNVGVEVNDVQVMRVNKEYWNKNLPRSAIQILSFNLLADKERHKREAAEKLKNNGGSYHVSRFLEALDIKPLQAFIE